MTCRTARLRLSLPAALIALAGCASTVHEPTVAGQPRDITAREAVAEADAATDTDGAAGAGGTRRYGPTASTVGEIHERSAQATAPLDFWQRLDHGHDRIYARMQEYVEATDRRFAKPGTELLPVPAAPFRIGVTGEFIDRRDGLDFQPDLDFDVQLRLPNIEQRLRIFITSVDLDESPRDASEDTELRAGLRYELRKYVNFDIGVKAEAPPVAFMSVRWAREYHLGRWDFYPLAKLFAETDESIGYAAATTFDHWSGGRLLRSSSFVKWRQDRDEMEWTQTLIHARARQIIVPDRYGSYLRASDIGHGWGLRLLASGENMHGASRYEASLFFKRPTTSRWLYWVVEPLVTWEREYAWRADPGIRIGLDALFWDLARNGKHR
ncbi:MAG: hypothetical protein KF790_04930 [Steroidobacteraceae bacterium]|nr:hypothetical protein [Steroidobacteraceae bacterium]MCW5572740.1 hypothetical protein [Steroidobacteraceae bacterium]